MNIEDKKQQLAKLREQEQEMYHEIERLENDIAADAAKDILARIKECKFDLARHEEDSAILKKIFNKIYQ